MLNVKICFRSSSPVAESNPLNTTPEFRDFVAKKLSELLDQSVVHVYCYLIIEIYKKAE